MIGIITPYKVPNYGTKLQAYAMQEMLNMYDESEIIDFVGTTDYRLHAVLGKIRIKINKYKATKLNSTIAGTEKPEYIKSKKERICSINKFDEQFYRFSVKVKGTISLSKLMKKYRAIVCGSDQLWAPLNVDADYFTLTIVPKGVPRISFSASFGISVIPKNYHAAYKRFLKKMDHISVREDSGRDIVKNIINKDVPVTLDPTLMLSRSTWLKLAGKSTYNLNKYIFCYFLGSNKEHRSFAKELSLRTGCKIVTFPHCEQYNDADVGFADQEISNAQPQDFVNLIFNADYVCTDSFHGTVFSIISKRKVAVFERFSDSEKGSTNSRIYSLLGKLELESILMKTVDDVDRFMDLDINYAKTEELLEAEKEKSFTYLNYALGLSRRND